MAKTILNIVGGHTLPDLETQHVQGRVLQAHGAPDQRGRRDSPGMDSYAYGPEMDSYAYGQLVLDQSAVIPRGEGSRQQTIPG